MEQATINAIGLVVNMIGVVIIFLFGPPQPVLEEGVSIGLEDGTPIDSSGKTVSEYNEEIKRKRKCISIKSKLGLIVIFIGFSIQLYATIVK